MCFRNKHLFSSDVLSDTLEAWLCSSEQMFLTKQSIITFERRIAIQKSRLAINFLLEKNSFFQILSLIKFFSKFLLGAK